jgi:hypothetical protein
VDDPFNAVSITSDAFLIITPLYLTRHILHDRALYGRLAVVFIMGGSTTFITISAGILQFQGKSQGAFMAALLEVRYSPHSRLNLMIYRHGSLS